MSKKIIFATGNEGKMKEVRSILADLDFEILSLKEAEINIDIVEDGKTFEENTVIKAKAISSFQSEYGLEKCIVLADDSGLEIDYLGKAPGVYSARYMGEDTSYDIKNKKILELLEGVSEDKRTARFVCVIAAVFPSGEIKTAKGTIEGIIGYNISGENGFGYDPIFYLPEYNCTTSELSVEQKNKISHRGKALNEIKDILIREEN